MDPGDDLEQDAGPSTSGTQVQVPGGGDDDVVIEVSESSSEEEDEEDEEDEEGSPGQQQRGVKRKRGDDGAGGAAPPQLAGTAVLQLTAREAIRRLYPLTLRNMLHAIGATSMVSIHGLVVCCVFPLITQTGM